MKIYRISSVINDTFFHGSKSENITFFNIPEESSLRGKGIFFSNSIKYARLFGPHVYICLIELSNPKIYNDSLEFTIEETKYGGVDGLYNFLIQEGYDSIVINRSKVSIGIIKEVICFYSYTIKSIKKL
jgi:hypothetical protein